MMEMCNIWSNTIFFLLIPLTFCLRITEVHVPSLVDVRGHAELGCNFDLQTSRLNSVKWYKDEMEFFRYVPQSPYIYTFDTVGVHVDKSRSSISTVILSPLIYASSGVYVCEVSTEAPLFAIDKGGGNMTVIGIPKTNPVIEGVDRVYPLGGYIDANCTTAPSRPPAHVEWRINGQQASEFFLDRFKYIRGDSTPKDEYGLEPRAVGLRFQLQQQHFLRHTLNLTCIASVQGIVKRSSVVVLSSELQNSNYAQQNLARGRSAGGRRLEYFLSFSALSIAVYL